MLRILVGDDFLELSQDDLDWRYIDEGNESMVYKYGDEALKIYKRHCRKTRLTEEEVSKLTQISTSRLLLPRRIIRDVDSGEFLGYTTPYLQRASTVGISKMKMDRFMDEIDLIKDDVDILTSSNVEVDDLNIGNTAYNGLDRGIYLVDPGSFSICVNPNMIRYLRSNNFSNLNNYIKSDLFKLTLPRCGKRIIEETFSDCDYVGDMIRETARCDETLKQYVKRMIS